jgi:hypothetical protein
MENNPNDNQTNILPNQSNKGTNSPFDNLRYIPNNTSTKTLELSAYAIFCREQIAKAREEDKRISRADCANAWKNSDDSTKAKYYILAEEKKKDRCEARPGPYNYFLMDLNKRNIFTGLTDAAESWKKLSEDERSKYITQAEQDQQTYNTKRQELNNISSTGYGKAKSAFNFFIADQKDYPENLPQGGFFNWCYDKWRNSDESVKAKYQKLADDAAKEQNSNIYENDTKVIDIPIKPMSVYNRFVKARISYLKEEHPDKEVPELFHVLDEEWRMLENSEKEKYKEQYLIEFENYKDKMKEYQYNRHDKQ